MGISVNKKKLTSVSAGLTMLIFNSWQAERSPVSRLQVVPGKPSSLAERQPVLLRIFIDHEYRPVFEGIKQKKRLPNFGKRFF